MCRIFVPGDEDLIRGTSRADGVVQRCLQLSEEQVEEILARTIASFESRHRDLIAQFELHFAAVAGLVDETQVLSPNRKLLIGAYLTQEYAFEATAYFNPSMVLHPDQSDVDAGSIRYIMSVRAVGEGHISSIVFRTGTVSATGEITVDPEPVHATTVAKRYGILRNKFVMQLVIEAGLDTEDLALVLGMLPDKFSLEEFEVSLAQIHVMREGRFNADAVMERLREITRGSYEVDFDVATELTERVLWPTVATERHGMEDARWVLMHEPDGSKCYRATYTGFDGQQVCSRVLETNDFRRFTSMELTGPSVANKGVAFFPRQVGGKYMALSRWDRETNSITTSEDGYHWNDSHTFQEALRPWELVQIGNAGSPLETPEGWLVITHGAGPMREYTLGAVLLDLEDPRIVRAMLPMPLLTPVAEERNGYVPNVVYSCGGLIHNGILILPYGFSDSGTRFATINVSDLLAQMEQVSELLDSGT
jgi:predicted GH43/DUF377 family glycosyl hydrolase